MKTETLFERPRIEGSGDALKQGLRSFGARARDAGLASMGFNKARGRLSIRLITDKLIKGFMTYVGAQDIHPVTDDTVRDYISRYFGQQLAAVEPTIQQITGVVPPPQTQQGQPPQPNPAQAQAPQGTQPPQPTPGAPVANTQTWTAPTGPQAGTPNIASTRQSTPADMGRYQALLGQINQSVMNPTPDPQFMNKIAALLKSASGSKNLRQYAKQKIDELKARPDVTQRYPEIANIGDDPFASPLPSGYSTTGTQAGGAPMPPATTPYTINPAATPPPATTGETPTAAPPMPVGSRWTWRSNDTDYPVVVTAPPQERNGQYWAMIQYTDKNGAHQTGAPVTQLTPRTAAEPTPTTPAAATGNRFNRVQPPPLNGNQIPAGANSTMSDIAPILRPQNNAQPQLGANVHQTLAQIGPILRKPTVTPQDRWWVMAAVDNALRTTQRGTPQRQQIVATLRALQNDPRVTDKIPQLKQIPMESHQRVFDLAVFLVENQIIDKAALREAYRCIMLEATTLNRSQIDQIFMVLARNLSTAGLAYTQRGGKSGQHTAQGQSNSGWSSHLDPQRIMATTITPHNLQLASKHTNINPRDYQLLVQAVGQNGEKVQQILRTLKNKITQEMVEILIHAAGNNP